MVQEITIERDPHHPDASTFDTLTYAINALIRKVNVLCDVQDRKYATNEQQRVLQEHVDPNVRE